VRRASGSSNNNSSAAKATPSRKTPSPALKGVDPKLAQIILDEILEGGASVQWEDIAGQEVQLTRLTSKVIYVHCSYPRRFNDVSPVFL
jgi:spastin